MEGAIVELLATTQMHTKDIPIVRVDARVERMPEIDGKRRIRDTFTILHPKDFCVHIIYAAAQSVTLHKEIELADGRTLRLPIATSLPLY